MAKKILIVGASSGLGRALVSELLSEASFIGCHFFHEKKSLMEFVHGDPDQASVKILRGDLRHQRACHRLVDRFVDWAGGIDALVQLTGSVSKVATMSDLRENEWVRDIEINLSGPFFVAQRAMRHMQGGAGRIIFTSTASAKHGGGNQSIAYGVAKAGVECLTKALAREGAKEGILVNAVAPGFISTKFHKVTMKRSASEIRTRISKVPLQRAGTPREVSSLIRFLLREESAYITGEIISVSGGDWL